MPDSSLMFPRSVCFLPAWLNKPNEPIIYAARGVQNMYSKHLHKLLLSPLLKLTGDGSVQNAFILDNRSILSPQRSQLNLPPEFLMCWRHQNVTRIENNTLNREVIAYYHWNKLPANLILTWLLSLRGYHTVFKQTRNQIATSPWRATLTKSNIRF